jgi:hypothetical protein
VLLSCTSGEMMRINGTHIIYAHDAPLLYPSGDQSPNGAFMHVRVMQDEYEDVKDTANIKWVHAQTRMALSVMGYAGHHEEHTYPEGWVGGDPWAYYKK